MMKRKLTFLARNALASPTLVRPSSGCRVRRPIEWNNGTKRKFADNGGPRVWWFSAAIVAFLGGCINFSDGCPDPARGPTYPNEPSREYQAVAVAEFATQRVEYWSQMAALMRTTIIDRLRKSGEFAEVHDGSAPATGQPALLLTGVIAEWSLYGSDGPFTATPYVAGRFELHDDTGNILAEFIEISCGTHGQSGNGERLVKDVAKQAAGFVVDYAHR